MFIKRLELQGFKTFPDRTRILFNPGITIIIGPNGTGKSNIVEAIQWVLGGQRVRTVRGEKSDDAIFTGTANRPALGMADVSLILQNTDDEMAINHRVFRSGESEYRLNGKMVRLKDIQDELWKRAVSENRYFVIEQGAIGTFVTSKPAEKRALIEEAAGTAFYKDKRRQAENKLEDSAQNLARLEDIIAEVAKSRNSLARQAGAAERYRRLRERIRELTSLHYRQRSDQLAAGQTEITARYESGLAEERALLARLTAAEREVNERRAAVWDLEKSSKAGKDDLYALRSRIARIESDREREARRIEYFEETRGKAVRDADELLAELLELERGLARAREDEDSLAGLLEAKRGEVGSLETAHHETQSLLSVQAGRVESGRADHLQKLAELTSARNEEAKLEKEIELLRRQEDKLRTREADTRDRARSMSQTVSDRESRHETIQAEIEAARDALGVLTAALAESTDLIGGLESRIRDLKDRREADAHHLQALRKVIEAERAEEAATVLEDSPGLFAELIETEAADAPLVDVFWKDEAGAAVVDPEIFLQRLRAGPVKGRFFLLREAPSDRDLSALLGESGVLGTLKSRLRPDARLAGGLASLPDAAVVDDIRTAVRLWVRHPGTSFVTPSGDVLFASGLLRLGRRGEGLFALHQEIRGLERSIAGFDAGIAPLALNLEDAQTDRRRLESERSEAAVRRSGLERDLAQAEKDHSLALAERDNLTEDIAVFGHELEVMTIDREALGRRLAEQAEITAVLAEEETGLRSRVEAEASDFNQRRETLHEEGRALIEIGGAVEVLETRIQSVRDLARSLDVRREAAQSKIRSLRESVLASEGEEERLKALLFGLQEEAAGLEARETDLESELAGKEERLETLRAELAAAEAELGRLRADHDRRKDERMSWEVRKAELERDMVNLEETCWTELKQTLQEIKAGPGIVDPRTAEPPADVEAELEAAREELSRYKAVNLMADEEYLQQKERHDFLVRQRNDLRTSIGQTQEAIRQIDEESRGRFLAALKDINAYFQDLFQTLFKGGAAEVRLVDENDPLESGIEVIAQPPGKKVSNMGLLSGGEKSLTSLAFLFSLFRFKPTPFCILDEIDAALDEVNLARFLELMKKIKSETQFIIITHNYKTMEVADYIYGTTMEEPNVTKIFSMKLERKAEAEAVG